jgi:outer membrane receptor protein involved in Fe transport
VDGRTGAPLEKVLVVVEDLGKSALTDADGRFQIDGLTPGPHRLYVSVVGYSLFRRDVTAGGPPLTVRLNEGTVAYSETVTVTPDVFRAPPDPVPSAQVLGSAELQNLRGVLADDPLRAVQVLPGVATGDDLRSEFTVRGSDFRHLTVTVDGFATPYLVHTVRGVEDRGPTGSVAMINSDVLEDVTLSNGGYAQRYGGHTGAEVDFRLREGSRDRRIFHVAVSGTNASAVAEGPIGTRRRGAWLISARQSYLDLIVHHLTSHSISFDFADAQARVAYDLTSRQRIDVTALAGHSRFQNEPGQTDIADVYDATNASVVGVAAWRLTLSTLLLTQRVLATENHFRNRNPTGLELENGHDRELAYRADVTSDVRRSIELSGGALIERLDDGRLRSAAVSPTTLVPVDDYRANAVRSGAYVSARWTPTSHVTVAPGARVDHWTLTSQSTTSPWVQSEWQLAGGRRLRASAGRYQQFPDFDRVLGVAGNPTLRPERANQFDAGLEQRLGTWLRLSATLYDRQEHDMLRQPGADTLLFHGIVARGTPYAPFENRLDGFARGVELMLQRATSGRGLSGWLSYAYGRNRYHDVVSGETFWGDFDQRHTFNAYALYRHSDRASFVTKFRLGSNFPVPGYYAERDGAFSVSDVRNTARLPTYARLDLRANRTFTWSGRRLTLFAEVINALNRANVRFTPPFVNRITRATTTPFASLLPIIPSVGILIEF